MDFNKYNPIKKPPLKDWLESTPVILLSEYLKNNRSRGIVLRQSDEGIPCLVFIPGLTNADKDNGRWQIAENAEGLFVDAIDDLKELIANGKLQLPISNGCKQRGKRQ